MAKELFRAWRPKDDTLQLITQCINITEEYMEQGYKLTLRQLYYQLVSRDVIPNTDKSYKKLSSYCTRARLAGLMDWSAIEDRARRPHKHAEFDDLADLSDAALRSYRLPRWDSQPEYAELWVEKDALASVLTPIADDYHVTLMVNRGYSSASAMKESAERIRRWEHKKYTTIFYLGDLDPSGEDMVRDISARMDEFGVLVHVEKVALTMEQVEEYSPPPNPAKLTDPRAASFVDKYGTSSWEVDALSPAVLTEIIETAFDGVIDRKAMDEVEDQEQLDKVRLREAVAEIMGGV